jgi:hypothetical protein
VKAEALSLKFDNILHFFIPKEKVEEIREKMAKKLIEVNKRLGQCFFFPSLC